MKPKADQAPPSDPLCKLPKPAAGKVIIVPLALLPAYLARHKREPVKWHDGVLYVKPVEETRSK